MIADGRRPGAARIMSVFLPSRLVEMVINLRHIAPVDHILGLKHLHAHEMEIRRHHIIHAVDPDDIGVGEVGIENGIDIRTVALVAPQERSILRQGAPGHGQEQGKKQFFHMRRE